MTNLSVNLNKIALIRNSRGEGMPDLNHFAELVLKSAAIGVTLHPRPDARHATSHDVFQIKEMIVAKYPDKELNLEGNPFAKPNENYIGFLNMVEEALPHQVTLVPDEDHQLTSNHGWELKSNFTKLEKVIRKLKEKKLRVSLFLDHQVENLSLAKELGADRVEIHTGHFAKNFSSKHQDQVLRQYMKIAEEVNLLDLGLNAGHDLNLLNVALFVQKVAKLAEVSIGHALICESLEKGFQKVLNDYLTLLGKGGAGS